MGFTVPAAHRPARGLVAVVPALLLALLSACRAPSVAPPAVALPASVAQMPAPAAAPVASRLAGAPVTGSVAASVAVPVAAPAAAPAGAPLTEHVVVISIDGLRPDAIARYGMRTLGRLAREGSHTLAATTILPSITLPSHTSMLTGTEPEVHGVLWNSEEMELHGYLATPTIFTAARQAGLGTAAFFSKSKFHHLQVPGTLDWTRAPGNWPGHWPATRTVAEVESYLAHGRPNLLFVHLAEPDLAGHLTGWMSRPYGWAVGEADAALGRLLQVAERAFGPGGYTVIVTADHGGHGRGHGSADPLDVTIPWVAWGRGVSPGRTIESAVRTVDTAATALWLLGVPAPGALSGRPVLEAFEAPAVTAAGPPRS